ncbi:hypothetical protein GF359_07485 [candidate division WOR-3 bacterium]|uniref:FlgD/Vpr Ig-like domain-containing protein n=1 Tax=candidate division WOR-3 bacterium TaxID=2052148 RepID=A0A9D5KA27_UNCW3|nr:hypothetical protein [candidate division WOR-3 bacterium]MBD3365042.1 hypothetical protein [candidate division WOR-3 bacterium]
MKRSNIVLGVTALLATAIPAFALSGKVWSEVEGNTGIVHHDDVYFNCCADMAFEIVQEGKVIDIYERDLGTHPCYCMCYYDFIHKIDGLAPGTYTANVWEASYDEEFKFAGTTTFTIKVQTGSFSTTTLMSECHNSEGVEEPRAPDEGLTLESLSAPSETYARISYHLPHDAETVLEIFDAAGNRVRILDLGDQAAGEHLVVWDTRNQAGQQVSRGIYFVRLQADSDIRTLSLVVLR